MMRFLEISILLYTLTKRQSVLIPLYKIYY